jgi:hypothetical protein
MSDNVATVEPQVQTQANDAATQQQQDVNVSQIMSDTLWGLNPTQYQPVEAQPAQQQAASAETQQQPTETQTQVAPEEEVIGLDEWFQREYGMAHNDFKAKWETYSKQPEVQPTQQDIQWANDDSKKFFEYLKEGKEDDIYNFLNQKKQLERLEKYDVADANQAAEILKANLQFKYKDVLSPQEIDRQFAKQYSLPAKPAQQLDQTDEEYAATVESWQQQVQEKQMDMIIEAKLAKPELSKLKSQIVLPDIQSAKSNQGPSPEELAEAQKRQEAYLHSLEDSIKTFGDVKITYKDKEVELPLTFTVTNEQKAQVKSIVEGLYTKWDYFLQKWANEDGSFNTSKMADDIYWLEHGKTIAQNLINDAGSQRLLHETKVRNNINLNGVNKAMGPTNPTQAAPKNESQAVAERIWSL